MTYERENGVYAVCQSNYKLLIFPFQIIQIHIPQCVHLGVH